MTPRPATKRKAALRACPAMPAIMPEAGSGEADACGQFRVEPCIVPGESRRLPGQSIDGTATTGELRAAIQMSAVPAPNPHGVARPNAGIISRDAP